MKFSFLIYLLSIFTLVLSMNMDMDDEDSSASTVFYSMSPSETPIPHVIKHPHGVPILKQNLLPLEREFWEAYNTTTFLSSDYSTRSNLIIHMVLFAICTIVLYPICLTLNNIESNWYLPALTIHLIFLLISILNYWIFEADSPDLYPGNAYSKMIVIFFFMISTHFVVALIHYTNKWINLVGDSSSEEFIPLNDYYKDTPLSPILSNSESQSNDVLSQPIENVEQQYQSRKFRINLLLVKLYNKFPNFFKSSHKISTVLFDCLNYPNFFMFLVLLPTQIATVNVLGQGPRVFNLLAHWIKGGVFFLLGIVTLARSCGAFTNLGWSWNPTYDYSTHKTQFTKFIPKGRITMEFVETSLILFYGSTNVFLEHLGSSDGVWTPKDLQHVSIAFIFFSTGLCGTILEYNLSHWRYDKAVSLLPPNSPLPVRASCGYSPNPFPVMTIFCTGVLMSKHEQGSMLGTEVHVLWGNFFVYGSAIRFCSYLLMILFQNSPSHINSPLSSSTITNNDDTQNPFVGQAENTELSTRSNYIPLKPPTEILVTFCLFVGGLIFMISSDPVLLALEYRGLTSMFVLNLSIGVGTLIMAWIMALFVWRGKKF